MLARVSVPRRWPTAKPDHDAQRAIADTGAVDSFGSTSDWIELHNRSTTGVSIEGSTIGDGANTWSFPAVSLAGGHYLVIRASGQNTVDRQCGHRVVDDLYARRGLLLHPRRLCSGHCLTECHRCGHDSDDVTVDCATSDRQCSRAGCLTGSELRVREPNSDRVFGRHLSAQIAAGMNRRCRRCVGSAGATGRSTTAGEPMRAERPGRLSPRG